MKCPDPPAHDRFGQRVALGPDAGLEECLAHGEGAAGSAGTGSAAGAGSAWGTGTTSGTGIETGSTSKTRLGRPMFMRPRSFGKPEVPASPRSSVPPLAVTG